MIIIQICDIFQKKGKSHLILEISGTMLIMNVKSWYRFFNETFPSQGNLKLGRGISLWLQNQKAVQREY